MPVSTPMFTAALFTPAKRREQPKDQSTEEQINNVEYTCNGVSVSLQQEKGSDPCYAIEGPRRHAREIRRDNQKGCKRVNIV